ncbi:MAG: Holliday junction resolvase RuvX [Tannerella sp.]|jgi:putative Holliday junction resolvase|nr:Holliday junction resolvase RuvX [Tannerella sp.]
MGRIMAIDYGRKRTGLAVTDTMQLIASGLTTVSSGEAMDYIETYTAREKVDLFVIGEPKQMNNKPSENMHYVEAFVNRLRKVIPDIPVVYFDERFTSVMAHKAMIEGGLKKKKRQDRALVDEISATLILQGYMEKKRFILQTEQTDF